MKVFMLGWEFPPFISGGLGTACYGLTKSMSGLGTQITFVLPKTIDSGSGHVKMLSTEGCITKTEDVGELKNVQFREIITSLTPYAASGVGLCTKQQKKNNTVLSWQNNPSDSKSNYTGDIFEQVRHYTDKVVEISTVEDFDIIHAHDWMTYPAGMAVARLSGRPLVVHVHSTEFDRSGENVNRTIYDIERQGMHEAHKVVAVSNYTKNIITSRYDVSPDRVEVVYNGVETGGDIYYQSLPKKSGKVVLYLGRVTMQKGPEYFITAAKKVLEKMSDVKFVMAGDGDMTNRMVEYAAWLGIGHKVFFTRFLRGADVDRAYRMADLYVMPSVSEPFGIAALEALRHNVPVLVSKQSGVAEVLRHVLKVDFWDINQMADKMAAVLKHQPLSEALAENGHKEAVKMRWEDSAARINEIYKLVLAPAKM